MSFTCSIPPCSKPTDNPIHINEDERVCHDCVEELIIPRFHQILECEHDYPFRWAGSILQPEQFIDWLGPTFIQRWARRKAEYESTDRIYCPHVIEETNVLPVGEITLNPLALSDAQQADCTSQGIPTTACGGFVGKKTDEIVVTACMRCRGSVCTSCSAAIWGPSSAHNCKSLESDSQNSDPLVGQIRGKDYQICYKCFKMINLLDGCNHVSCNCGGQFCYICGNFATADSGHWNTGSTCPRFGQLDNPRRQFDTPLSDDYIRENFADENGLPFAGLIGEDGFDEEIVVPLTGFQQTTQEHLDRLAEDNGETTAYPLWLSETIHPVPEIGFSLGHGNSYLTDLLPAGDFVQVRSDPEPELDRKREEIEDFFDERTELLNTIVETMVRKIPRPLNLRPQPPRQTPDEDVVIEITPNQPGQSTIRHEHRFSVELQQIVRFLGTWVTSQGRDMPSIGPLLPSSEVMLVTFSGDLSARRIDEVYFEPVGHNMEHDMEDIRGTNALVDALNDELYMRADLLVREILRRFHHPDWVITEDMMDLSE